MSPAISARAACAASSPAIAARLNHLCASIRSKTTPDVPVDQNPKGDPEDVLVTREIDYQNHLHNTQKPDEQKAIDAREARRLEELRRLEEENAKKTPEERKKERDARLPDLGSADDFMLQQAVHQLKGEPVQRTKSRLEANAGPMPKDASKAASPAATPAKPSDKK